MLSRPLIISFPFDIKRSPVYEIIYFFAAWSSWFTTVGVSGLGGLFFGMCLHVAGQFDILRLKLVKICGAGNGR